jgi:muconate cycloisomerase
MRITNVEAIPLQASFKRVFRFGTTDRTTSSNVVIRITTDDGLVGYGEACPVQAFTAETQATIVELVETRVSPTLVGRDPSRRVPLLADLARVLRFAPFTEDPARVVESALEQRETYRWLKLYAGRGDIEADLGRLQAVRDAVGTDARLIVDVNGMWSASGVIRALEQVHPIGIELLEQPLPPGAEPFARDLVARLAVDVAADESVRTVADAMTVVRERTATVVNVGLSKLGGPTAALRAAQLAAAGGVGVMVGSVLEMGIATAMGLHLAAAVPHLAYPSYLMGPLKYREQITAAQITVVDAHVAVPKGPGLGIDVDEDALRHLDARR